MYIQLDRNMNLTITNMETIRRGDDMARKIVFLVPKIVGDIDMASAALYLSYRRADGMADIDLLRREEEPYNANYYEYRLPITTLISRFPGEVTTFITVFSGPHNGPMVLKSGVCVLHIEDSENLDDVISDRNLRLIYSMQKQMEDKVEKAEKTLNERIDKTDEVVAAKADNIAFDEENSTIQLVSTIILKDEKGNEIGSEQIPLGDPIFVRTDTSRGIINMEINELGELIVTFDDETTQNLGTVVGRDGSVYVPHVDEHKVLTFTIESEPAEVPEPVDLNPNDEWSDMEDGGIESEGNRTTYVWEDM